MLICAVELCSLHHQYQWQPDQIVANALFADGAAAAIVRSDSSDTSANAAPSIVDLRSAVLPDSTDFIQWHIGDNGFAMALSPQVPGLIEQKLRPWLESWLAENRLSVDEIGSWAIHPGGPRILEACASAIEDRGNSKSNAQPTRYNVPAGGTATLRRNVLADSEAVLAEFGNMSSPTVIFILDRLRRRDAPRPIVSLAFGPGVAIEAALLR